MQAIVMAAGRGKRLGGLTDSMPKSFLEVRGIKLLEYNLALLKSLGVDDIVIVTGYHAGLIDHLTREMDGVRLVYNPFYEMMNVLGSFYMAQDLLGKDDLIYMHADTLCAPSILRDAIASVGDIVLPVDFRECDDEAMKVCTSKGKVTKISKIISLSESEGEFIGVCTLSSAAVGVVKDQVREILTRGKFDSYFEAAIQGVIDCDIMDVIAMPTEGRFWGEVDFLEDYQRVATGLPEDFYEIAKAWLEGR